MSSRKLWIGECEGLKKGLNHTLVSIECLEKRDIEKSLSSTKESRTADKITNYKPHFSDACQKTGQHDQLQQELT